MDPHNQRARGWKRCAAVALIAIAGCSEPETPEAAVRATLVAIEAAAEAGDVDAFRELVSDAYQDDYGHDKQRLADLVRFHVLRHPRGREVIVRVRDVQLTSETSASVMAHAGLAGAGQSALRADAYAIDADLRREDDVWRVVWARWRRVAPAELL